MVRNVFSILAVAALLGSSSAQAVARPWLRATSFTPLSVAGMNFPRTTRIRVDAKVGAVQRTRVVRTNARGNFAASFGLSVNPCVNEPVIVARRVGSHSVLARLRAELEACG
jgi:hypothetical protein